MIPNQIPYAIHHFNQETIQKKNNVRDFLGLKRINNSYSGLYGTDFLWEETPVDKNNYIPCLETGCSFRGPSSMMDFHVKTVHESGLECRFDLDSEAWRKDRKKHFPKSSNVKQQAEKTYKKFERKSQKHLKVEPQNEPSRPIPSDPMFAFLEKKCEKVNTDLLGLGALYGSSDEEEIVEEKVIQKEYVGLPLPTELTPKQLLPRKNKFRFPILPQMDLHSKRNALMNPQRRYHEHYNRKAKRPRLADLLVAEDIISERNMVLQCIRYIVNKRFFDPSLQNIPFSNVKDETKNEDDIDVEEEPEKEDTFFKNNYGEEIEIDDNLLWSDNDE